MRQKGIQSKDRRDFHNKYFTIQYCHGCTMYIPLLYFIPAHGMGYIVKKFDKLEQIVLLSLLSNNNNSEASTLYFIYVRSKKTRSVTGTAYFFQCNALMTALNVSTVYSIIATST